MNWDFEKLLTIALLMFVSACSTTSSEILSQQEFAKHVNNSNHQGAIGEVSFSADMHFANPYLPNAVNAIVVYDKGSHQPQSVGNGIRIRDRKNKRDYILTAQHVVFGTSSLKLYAARYLFFGYPTKKKQYNFYDLSDITPPQNFDITNDIVILSVPFEGNRAALPIENILDVDPIKPADLEYFSTSVLAFPYGDKVGRLTQSFSVLEPYPLAPDTLMASDLDAFDNISGSPVFGKTKDGKSYLLGLVIANPKKLNCKKYEKTECASIVIPIDLGNIRKVTNQGLPLLRLRKNRRIEHQRNGIRFLSPTL